MKLYRGNLIYQLRITKSLFISALLISVITFQSCTVTTRVTSNLADNACPDAGKHLCHRSKTHWIFFGGAAKEKAFIAKQCSDENITTVDFKQNYLYTAITFLTLGLVAPVKVEWNCSAGRG